MIFTLLWYVMILSLVFFQHFCLIRLLFQPPLSGHDLDGDDDDGFFVIPLQLFVDYFKNVLILFFFFCKFLTNRKKHFFTQHRKIDRFSFTEPKNRKKNECKNGNFISPIIIIIIITEKQKKNIKISSLSFLIWKKTRKKNPPS